MEEIELDAILKGKTLLNTVLNKHLIKFILMEMAI